MKFLAIFTLFLLPAFFAAAQDKWITFYNSSIELNATVDKNTVTMPLKLKDGISFKDVSIKYNRPVYIRFDKKFDKEYLEGFSISPKADSFPAIEITVDMSKIRTNGTYEGLVAFENNGKTEELNLSIIHPAAKLETLNPVHITIVGDEVKKADPFVVKETTRLSNVAGLQLQPPLFSGVNSNKLVTFKPDQFTIKAGSVFNAEYTVNTNELSKLPLGKTTGKMEISAPELSAPLSIDFEIMNKRSNSWMFGVIFLGILCGYLVRHYIKEKKELEEKRIGGYDLIERITTETQAVEDEDFLALINTTISNLQEKLQKKYGLFGRKDTLTADIQAAVTEYGENKKDFDARLESAKGVLSKLSFLFENNNLQREIKQILAKANDHYISAKKSLVKKNATVAKREADFSVTEIKKFVREYSLSVEQLCQDIEAGKAYPSITLQPIKDALKKMADNIKNRLSKITETDDTALLVNSVNEAASVQNNEVAMLNFLEEKVKELFNRQYQDNGTPLMKSFKEHFDSWSASLQKVKEMPLDPLDTTMLPGFDSDWAAVNASAPQQTRLGGGGSPVNTVNPLPWLQRTVIERGIDFFDMGSAAGSLQARAGRARQNWIILVGIQSFILFLILSFGVYKIYASSFIGTFDELLGIFLFAFGLDLTLENITGLKDKKA